MAASQPKGKTGFGIDEPRSIIELAAAGILAITIGFVLSYYFSQPDSVTGIPRNADLARIGLLVGPGVGFLVLAVAAALFWSSQQGKVTEMGNLISDIPWGGNELVLDVGCGRGLGMVLAGRRLVGGYAVGVDLWQKSHLSGNSPLSIWANAEREGVTTKMAPVKSEPGTLPFVDASFDVVLSALSLHRLIKRKDRAGAFSELLRVLRDGGRVGILDAGNGSEYAKVLRQIGMSDISVHRLRFSSFPPFHVVIGRKPYLG